MALSGLALLVSSGNLFRWHNTTVNPIHPDEASTLVVNGLYRLNRFNIKAEEQALLARFGEPYSNYKKNGQALDIVQASQWLPDFFN